MPINSAAASTLILEVLSQEAPLFLGEDDKPQADPPPPKRFETSQRWRAMDRGAGETSLVSASSAGRLRELSLRLSPSLRASSVTTASPADWKDEGPHHSAWLPVKGSQKICRHSRCGAVVDESD